MEQESFGWTEAYRRISDSLRGFRSDRKGLIGKLKAAFEESGLKLPTVDYDGEIRDVDPFTVLGFFNRGLSVETRNRVIAAVAKAVGAEVETPADYNGVPLLNNLKVCFTGFSNDGKFKSTDIENLWTVFDLAIRWADGEVGCRGELESAWDQAVSQYCVKWNLSLGLFWTRPGSFVGLDRNNRRFIRDRFDLDPKLAVDNKVPGGAQYLDLCEFLKRGAASGTLGFASIQEMSFLAWEEARDAVSDMYWLTANPARWSLTDMAVGQEQSYTVRDADTGNLRQDAKAFRSIREGNFIFGYQAQDRKAIVSVLQCTAKSDGATVRFRKVCDLKSPITLEAIKANEVLSRSRPGWPRQGSLFRLRETEAAEICQIVEDECEVLFEEMCAGNGAEEQRRTVWFWAPGYQGSEWASCQKDGIICLGWDEIGPLDRYATRDEMESAIAADREEGAARPKNGSLACWEFLHRIKKGDIVVAKSGLGRLLGVGVVTGGYRRDESRADYQNVRPCRWLATESAQSPVKLPMKTLTDMSPWPEVVGKVLDALHFDPVKMQVDKMTGDPDQPDIIDEDEAASNKYTRESFLKEVFLPADEYDRLMRLVLLKKNVILTGAPGVGKTFAAKRFAYSLIGVRNSSRLEFVQFHQSYGYEDFVGGFRPDESGGFKYAAGIFARFCDQAARRPEEKFCFIIDEINRGNLSRIFGELLMLIEVDKRGRESAALAYTKEPFSVPENVYIIGMMNTADRSLAMMDYALRRRFCFYPMGPAFDSEGFRQAVTDPKMLRLVEAVKELNETIRADGSLGDGFVLGHSFFMGGAAGAPEKLPEDVVEFELGPTLREYWFDNAELAEREIEKLRQAIR